MVERQPCVYILTTAGNGTLYVGVTSDLMRRIAQHREGTFGGFTAEKNIKRWVYWEMAATMEAAIAREKAMKRRRRDWKRNLIERENPARNDLAIGLGFDPMPSSSGTVGPGTSPG